MNATKPMIFADDRSDSERFDPQMHRGHLDPSRIPGYSEIVMANDIAKSDALAFRSANQGVTHEDIFAQIGAGPATLDVEFQWLPITNAEGTTSSHVYRQLDRYMNQEGFRLATRDDLDALGYGFPPTAREAEDGTIRRGPDVALYVRSGEVARKWETFKFAQQAELAGANPEAYNAGGYEAPAFRSPETHETVTVKH